MLMEERQQEIAATIEVDGRILVSEITARYHISEESARRDLRMLEQKGLCKRVHGGAVRMHQVGLRPPADRDFSQMPIYDTYREIAKAAVQFIHSGDVIYLTGGSFGYIMLQYLPKTIPYTLVVNTVDMAQALRSFDNIETFMAGGKMRKSGSVTDSLAAAFVRNLHFDTCFLTGAGLTAEFGLTNGTDETATFQRTVLDNSWKRVLLMPGAKIGSDAFIRVCPSQRFQTIITDWECVPEQIDALQELGSEVIVVEQRNDS